MDEWQFDSFALHDACDGRPLSCVAFFLLEKMGLVRKFFLNETRLARSELFGGRGVGGKWGDERLASRSDVDRDFVLALRPGS